MDRAEPLHFELFGHKFDQIALCEVDPPRPYQNGRPRMQALNEVTRPLGSRYEGERRWIVITTPLQSDQPILGQQGSSERFVILYRCISFQLEVALRRTSHRCSGNPIQKHHTTVD